jgi:GNAT superfamily N-acetyltransferase
MLSGSTSSFKIREAEVEDIVQIQSVRHAVRENVLSDPGLVSDEDCKEYITKRGKGWVCEWEDKVVGFSIVDLIDHNVWALFVRPEFEKQGIGRRLFDTMIGWYFEQSHHNLWLSTSPGTRAEQFYRRAGWKDVGTQGPVEIRFELSYNQWSGQNNNQTT